jgi:hypothetical protein
MEEQVVGSTSSANNMHEVGNKNSNPYRNMVMDAMRMSEGNISECPIIEEEPNADAAKFFYLLKDFDEPLWDGCVARQKIRAASAGDFFFVVCLIDSLESPPSNLFKATRKPDILVLSEIRW